MEENKNLEKFTSKLMHDDELNSPSTDFTNIIMAKVEVLEKQKVLEYRPLISKKVWLLICTTFISVLAYLTLFGNLTKSKWMDYFDFDFSLNLLPELSFSNTTIYATTIVSIGFLVQIFMLKNYYNKRLSI